MTGSVYKQTPVTEYRQILALLESTTCIKDAPRKGCVALLCREGEGGDNLYVIQNGVFEAVKGSGDDEKLLFKYEGAGAFGELALMYNCRRAATVRVSL